MVSVGSCMASMAARGRASPSFVQLSHDLTMPSRTSSNEPAGAPHVIGWSRQLFSFIWRSKIQYRMAARYLLTIIGSMGKQLGPLTGLRGVAAYAVLIAHAAHASIPFYDDLIYQRLSAFGMSLFFVLSGFVIYYNYAETFARKGLASAGWQFFVARFARLYPLYAISIIIAPYLSIFREAPWVLMSYLTLTQSWFNVQIAVFPPAWSISTEWFFYLAFVPLLWVVRRVPRRFGPCWFTVLLPQWRPTSCWASGGIPWRRSCRTISLWRRTSALSRRRG
jgi:hypothetical protein